MERLYYTISEVAEMLGEKPSLVRYWSNEFSRELKLHRTGRGDRRYTADDIETLKQIHYLTNVRGLTLEGAAKALKEDRRGIDKSVKAIETLREIRAQLVEVKESL